MNDWDISRMSLRPLSEIGVGAEVGIGGSHVKAHSVGTVKRKTSKTVIVDVNGAEHEFRSHGPFWRRYGQGNGGSVLIFDPKLIAEQKEAAAARLDRLQKFDQLQQSPSYRMAAMLLTLSETQLSKLGDEKLTQIVQWCQKEGILD